VECWLHDTWCLLETQPSDSRSRVARGPRLPRSLGLGGVHPSEAESIVVSIYRGEPFGLVISRDESVVTLVVKATY